MAIVAAVSFILIKRSRIHNRSRMVYVAARSFILMKAKRTLLFIIITSTPAIIIASMVVIIIASTVGYVTTSMAEFVIATRSIYLRRLSCSPWCSRESVDDDLSKGKRKQKWWTNQDHSYRAISYSSHILIPLFCIPCISSITNLGSCGMVHDFRTHVRSVNSRMLRVLKKASDLVFRRKSW